MTEHASVLGIGASRDSAAGDVYGLARLADFPGLYGQFRVGAVVTEREVLGSLWLENRAGVQMHLRPREEDLALREGATDCSLVSRDHAATGTASPSAQGMVEPARRHTKGERP